MSLQELQIVCLSCLKVLILFRQWLQERWASRLVEGELEDLEDIVVIYERSRRINQKRSKPSTLLNRKLAQMNRQKGLSVLGGEPSTNKKLEELTQAVQECSQVEDTVARCTTTGSSYRNGCQCGNTDRGKILS